MNFEWFIECIVCQVEGMVRRVSHRGHCPRSLQFGAQHSDAGRFSMIVFLLKQYAQPGTAFRQHRLKPSCRAFLYANGNRCNFLATHQRSSSASGRWPSGRRAFRNIRSKRNPTCGLRVGLPRSCLIVLSVWELGCRSFKQLQTSH